MATRPARTTLTLPIALIAAFALAVWIVVLLAMGFAEQAGFAPTDAPAVSVAGRHRNPSDR